MPNDIHRVNGSVYRQTAADKKQEEELWKLRKSTALMHLHIRPKVWGLLKKRKKCVTDEEGHLLKINERTHIEKHDGGTAYTEDDGKTWTMLPEGSTVSMNMWGFSASILKELKDRFPKFLDENLKVNPLKCEYFLPFVVDELLGEKRATVKVLKSMDKWYGVTYKEDKPVVVAAIQNLKDGGLYPQRLWEE